MKQIRMAWRVSTSTGTAPVHTGQWVPDTPRNRQILEQSAKAANSIVDGSTVRRWIEGQDCSAGSDDTRPPSIEHLPTQPQLQPMTPFNIWSPLGVSIWPSTDRP
ncbi:hypothetical protein WAE61_19690 [Comamonadaceae bacterium PP-2]